MLCVITSLCYIYARENTIYALIPFYRNNFLFIPFHIVFSIHRIALSGTDITDQENFMDKLLNYRIENSSPVEDWRCQEQMGQEKQLEMIRHLQATVENQGKLLKAMADRLKISDIED